MPKSGTELLFLGLVIAGFMLFNYVAQQLAKKARAQQEATEAEPAAEAPAPAPEDEPLQDIWGRAPAKPPAAPEVVARAVPEPQAAPPLPSPGHPGVRLFRTRKDLQRAIVLMTVLGPCRALEPHERR
ncbi:MAG TPA: hypothetical protein VLA30_15675 [Burkholderiales bacterium]|nr:hypothetical protein [Burkholderiales bacterium]